MDPAPKFEKANHHWVPQFWLRRFRGDDNQLHVLSRGTRRISIAGTNHIMSQDHLYTVFDEFWRPGDTLEDALSRLEGEAGKLFIELDGLTENPTADQWDRLTWFLALSACRHPHILERGHELAVELGYDLADVGQTPVAYADRLRRYGLDVGQDLQDCLAARGEPALLDEAEEIDGLSPQDPRLPATAALEAADALQLAIDTMDLRLLTASPECEFVLGDAPMPLRGLPLGFCVPLSRHLAVWAEPAEDADDPVRARGLARPELVRECNIIQQARAGEVIVGPTRRSLTNIPAYTPLEN